MSQSATRIRERKIRAAAPFDWEDAFSEMFGDTQMSEKPKIITSHEYPPIPWRQFDWCAYREGREEEGRCGWGPTEEAAIADLLSNEENE
jgi:hypothetical protein